MVYKDKHPHNMTLNIYLTKDLGIEGGKYTIMCEETQVNIQFANKRELSAFCKNDPYNQVDWGA